MAEDRNTHVVVVGASGFVGRHLLAGLRRSGYDTLGTQCSSHRDDLRNFDLRTDRILDILPDAFLRPARAYVAICGGIANVAACSRDPAGSRQVNVTNTMRLIDDLAVHGYRPIYFSTSAVFDGTRSRYDESTPPSPLHEYGKQKAAMEDYVLSQVPGGIVVRLSKVLSADCRERHLLSEWLERVRENRPLECISAESFSPTAAADIAAAILRLMEGGHSGLFHVAAMEGYRRDDLARLFLGIVGSDLPIIRRGPEYFGFAEPRPLCSVLDSSKLITATGSRFTPVRQLIEDFWDAAKRGLLV